MRKSVEIRLFDRAGCLADTFQEQYPPPPTMRAYRPVRQVYSLTEQPEFGDRRVLEIVFELIGVESDRSGVWCRYEEVR